MGAMKRLSRLRRARVAQKAAHKRSANLDALGEGHESDEFTEEEEKVLDGRPDANIPAMLTKDVRGG